MSVDRKHSSHWAYTRGVTVSKSSTAERIVNSCDIDSIPVGSVRKGLVSVSVRTECFACCHWKKGFTYVPQIPALLQVAPAAHPPAQQRPDPDHIVLHKSYPQHF